VKGIGLEAELIVEPGKVPPRIVGIKRIGTREFVEGKMPAIQMSEDRPKPGNLFDQPNRKTTAADRYPD
jgi:hypothetical protein